MAGRLDAIWIATLTLSVGLVGIFITWKSSIRWITSFLVLKKINIHFIDCLCFYKSGYVYCLLYLFCFILQAVSTVLSTTSSWLFCLLLVQLVIHTYSIAKAQDSPCSLCRPGKPVNIKEHFNLVLEMWHFLGSEGNWILFLSSNSRTKVVLYQWLLTLSE